MPWARRTLVDVVQMHVHDCLHRRNQTKLRPVHFDAFCHGDWQAVQAVQYARSLSDDVQFSAEDAGRSDPAFLREVYAAVG